MTQVGGREGKVHSWGVGLWHPPPTSDVPAFELMAGCP